MCRFSLALRSGYALLHPKQQAWPGQRLHQLKDFKMREGLLPCEHVSFQDSTFTPCKWWLCIAMRSLYNEPGWLSAISIYDPKTRVYSKVIRRVSSPPEIWV